MNNSDEKIDMADSPEALLPWYHTNRLSPEDRGLAEAYLQAEPEAEAQLAILAEDEAGAIASNEMLGSPRAGALDRLMTSVEATPQQRSIGQMAGGWLAQLTGFMGDFASPGLRAGALAAAVLIVVQTIAIGSLLMGRSGEEGFRTASGEPTTVEQTGPRLLIVFQPDARATQITAIIQEVEGTIISGPRAGGVYEILITTDAPQDLDIEAIAARIRSRSNVVRLVSVAG